jgi:hypothetical protein
MLQETTAHQTTKGPEILSQKDFRAFFHASHEPQFHVVMDRCTFTGKEYSLFRRRYFT